MSFEKEIDTERGVRSVRLDSNPGYMSPSEKFLIFRDCSFVCIILLHLGTALYAIPALATHSAAPDSRSYLAVIIFVGFLAPVIASVGWRDFLPISKITSAIWFEFGWCTILMVMDFIVAVAQSSLYNAPKTSIALSWLQTITTLVYTLGLAVMVLLQHKRFPEVSIWKSTVQSIQWLRSPHPIDSNAPFSPNSFHNSSATPKGIIPPWQREYGDMHEIKLSSGNDEPKLGKRMTFLQSTLSPAPANVLQPSLGYVNAHPFWQERVQRQAIVEDDMAYIIQRYGLNIEADRTKEKESRANSNGGKHKRKGSIRDLEISRPVPIPSTVRRANTLATTMSNAPLTRGLTHQRGGSLQANRNTSLSIDLPRSNLDVPVDAVPLPPSASTRAIHINQTTRSLGLAGRTLIGTSRPKASAVRVQTISSKPLPSPPIVTLPLDDSDESMRSLQSAGAVSGSHSFVMGLAQRVQISASKVKPLLVSTPRAAEHAELHRDGNRRETDVETEDEKEINF